MDKSVTLLVGIDGEALEVVVTGPEKAVAAVVDALVESDVATVDETEDAPVEETE